MRQQSRTPTLAEVIRLAIKGALAELRVSLPGAVQKYDVAEQKADIQLLLKRPLVASDGTELASESLPQLMDVPVVFPRGGQGTGAAFITWPLAKGDLVHVHFCDYSIDQWLDKRGEETDPLDFRTHSLSDAVAYPGFYPRKLSLADAHAENLVIGWDGGVSIHVKPSGEIHLGSENASEFVALAQKVLTELQAVQTDQQNLQLLLSTHVHSGVTSGPSVTGTSPAFAGYIPHTPSSVAATKVKAD